jgi:hypothetical protein
MYCRGKGSWGAFMQPLDRDQGSAEGYPCLERWYILIMACFQKLRSVEHSKSDQLHTWLLPQSWPYCVATGLVLNVFFDGADNTLCPIASLVARHRTVADMFSRFADERFTIRFIGNRLQLDFDTAIRAPPLCAEIVRRTIVAAR